MLEAPLPHNEKERLAALHELHILDTPLEERFERIVRLARTFFGTKMSSFALIDERRQWQKAAIGNRSFEDSRVHSFCAHTILGNDVMVVPDARIDTRFADNPLVTGPAKIGFYAGCPVRAPTGHNVGTLCIVDPQPRTLSKEETQSLRDLAGLIESELRDLSASGMQQRLHAERTPDERAAYLDPLTHSWNEAGLLDILRREWNEAIRRGQPLALCLLELDGAIATQADRREDARRYVCSAARAMLSAFRSEDSVGHRTEGRLMAILPGCAFETAAPAAERLRLAIDALPFEGKLKPVASIAITHCLPGPGQTPETLLKRVEGALSIARKSGGRRVVVTADAARAGSGRPASTTDRAGNF